MRRPGTGLRLRAAVTALGPGLLLVLLYWLAEDLLDAIFFGRPFELGFLHLGGYDAVERTLVSAPLLVFPFLLVHWRSAAAAARGAERKARRDAARMRAVAMAAAGVAGARSLDDLLEVLRAACETVMPLDVFMLGVLDGPPGTLRILGCYDAGVFEPGTVVPLAGTPAARVVAERRPLLTLRSSDPRAAGAQLCGTGRRSESVIRTPVLAPDRVLGILSVQSYTPELYEQTDVEVLEALAALAATAILNLEAADARARTEEQLRHAHKMEAVGRLAGGVAHDFNNALTAISGYAEFLAEDLDSADPRRDDVLEILQAAECATGLTRQLLAFGRKGVLQPITLDLHDLAGRLMNMLRRLLGEDVQIATDFAASSSRILADPTQIEQVLVNLCVNARDAMPGGGKLCIATRSVTLGPGECRRLRPSLPAGEYVVLSVADTGAGMDDHVKSHIFEPFFTTKPPGHGTGLGLATVYGIAEQSGGAVTVESEPGRGSTFRVYLPRAAEAALADEPDESLAAAGPALSVRA